VELKRWALLDFNVPTAGEAGLMRQQQMLKVAFSMSITSPGIQRAK
jgi:hypothetical protein